MVFFTLDAYSYQPPDSCLKLINYPSGSANPDSVKIDSCEGSPTYLEKYGKQLYRVKFEYNIIPKGGIFPEDTIIEYTWRDIDSIYLSTMLGFKQLEINYGTFYFREAFPHLIDTTQFIKRALLLRFESYECIDSVVNFISTIPNVRYVAFMGGPRDTTNNDVTVIRGEEDITYNTASQVLTINAQKIYPQYNLQIFNLSGAEIMRVPIFQKTQDIDLSSLARGFYIIRFRESVAKIIVQ